METIAKKLGLFTVTIALLCGASSLRADVVCDNTVNDLQIRFGAQNGVQIGGRSVIKSLWRAHPGV